MEKASFNPEDFLKHNKKDLVCNPSRLEFKNAAK